MKKRITEAQILSLVLGELNIAEGEEIRKQVMDDVELKKTFMTYSELVRETKSLPIIEAQAMDRARFDDWLNHEITEQRNDRNGGRTIYLRILKYAVAASVFIAIGLFIGSKFGSGNFEPQIAMNEPVLTDESMLHWINTESTTTRIKGILASEAFIEADPRVRDALIEVMKQDKSANVRLAAVEALSIYIQDEVIKDGLISALKEEQEPIVQIAIINTMVGLKEVGAKTSLEEFIEGENVQPYVKDEARLGITRM